MSQNVKVTNNVSVNGTVRADVNGVVSVDNTVDVNLSEINGYGNCFYKNMSKYPNEYYRIPVYNNYYYRKRFCPLLVDHSEE